MKANTGLPSRIGFIGTGARASSYAVHLKKLRDVRVEYTAVCDINREFADRFNRLYCQGQAAVYENYQEMLKSHAGLLDGVIVCVPNDEHESVALSCLRADIH